MSDAIQDTTPRTEQNEDSQDARLPLLSLVFLRFIMLVVLPFEALVSYGDYRHFFNLARFSTVGGGLPFIGHWVEFPPLFPFLSLAIERLTGGQFHSYAYLLALLMLITDAGNLWIFSKLTGRLAGQKRAERMTWLYAVFLAIPAFGWWTFDPIAVFFMLLSIWLVLERRELLAGLMAGLGFLTKIFPLIALGVAWRFRSRRSAILATTIAMVISVAVLGTLLAANPAIASASLRSQFSKGSWQTVWALIDGNIRTGTLGPLEERLDPGYALQTSANPAKVPLWITTLGAGLVMIWLFIKTNSRDETRALPFLTTLWCILLLWSRGWSPQWMAYLIPLLLLSLPLPRSLIYGVSLVTVALLEWPILLSRGRFDLMWLPIVLRTLLIAMLGFECGRITLQRKPQT